MSHPSCPTCAAPLRWFPASSIWGCDRCRVAVLLPIPLEPAPRVSRTPLIAVLAVIAIVTVLGGAIASSRTHHAVSRDIDLVLEPTWGGADNPTSGELQVTRWTSGGIDAVLSVGAFDASASVAKIRRGDCADVGFHYDPTSTGAGPACKLVYRDEDTFTMHVQVALDYMRTVMISCVGPPEPSPEAECTRMIDSIRVR